jgi:hypothetical protein
MGRQITRGGWLAIGTGLLMGLGGSVAAGHMTGQAGAQSQDQAAGSAGFTLSVEQLRINQRISSAAVRRSNESLQLLDPVRPLPNRPNRTLGWRTRDLRDGAVTTPKLNDASVTPSKLDPALREGQPRWAVINGTTGERVRQKGAVASARETTGGEYSITWDRDITACAVQATIASPGVEPPPPGHTVAAWIDGDNPKVLRARTVNTDSPPVPADTSFHVTVLC